MRFACPLRPVQAARPILWALLLALFAAVDDSEHDLDAMSGARRSTRFIQATRLPQRAKEKMPDKTEALRAITGSAVGRTAAVIARRDSIRG